MEGRSVEIFGSLERLTSNLYPYRYLIAALSTIAVALVAWFAWRRGWHRVARSHPKATLVTTVVALAIAIPAGNFLLSPLWTRTMLEEESPLAMAATGGSVMATSIPVAATVDPTATAASSAAPSTTPEVPATTIPPSDAATPASDPTPIPSEPEPTATPPPPGPAPTEVPPEPTPEPEPEPFVAHVTHTGEFYGADDFHFGRGTALLIQVEPGVYVLRFEDFSVRNGPDLRVYLSTNPDGYSASDYLIGALRATDGSFNYDIPPDVDISIYRSVIIWCEPFAVLFAVAHLFAVAPS
jgi:hypothetical protein